MSQGAVSSVAMTPCPLFARNHFTVPVVVRRVPRGSAGTDAASLARSSGRFSLRLRSHVSAGGNVNQIWIAGLGDGSMNVRNEARHREAAPSTNWGFDLGRVTDIATSIAALRTSGLVSSAGEWRVSQTVCLSFPRKTFADARARHRFDPNGLRCLREFAPRAGAYSCVESERDLRSCLQWENSSGPVHGDRWG